jgi:hypothetical protein
MSEAYDGQQVVGMDLHRRRSVLVRMTADGRKLETARITNSPAELRRVSGVPPSFRTADPLGSLPERTGASGREIPEVLT